MQAGPRLSKKDWRPHSCENTNCNCNKHRRNNKQTSRCAYEIKQAFQILYPIPKIYLNPLLERINLSKCGRQSSSKLFDKYRPFAISFVLHTYSKVSPGTSGNWTRCTDIAPRQRNRAGLRYPSNLRDAESAVIEPLLPHGLAGRLEEPAVFGLTELT